MFYSKKSLKFLHITVENCPSHEQTVCKKCNKGIKRLEKRISILDTISLYYHLECCKFDQYIRKIDVDMRLDKTSTDIFLNWLEKANSSYFPLDLVPVQFAPKCLELPCLRIPNKRPWIEIFKFLEASEIIVLSNTCKKFCQIAQEDEIWRFLLNRDYQIISLNEDPKSRFIEMYYKNCIECKASLNKSNFNRCPILKKNICLDCLKLYKYRLLSKRDIQKSYGIEASLLRLKYWTASENASLLVTYQFLVEQKLRGFRFKQKEKVMKMLQVLGSDHPVMKIISGIDLEDLDEIKGSFTEKMQPVYSPKYKEHINYKSYKNIIGFIRCGRPELEKQRLLNLIRKEIEY